MNAFLELVGFSTSNMVKNHRNFREIPRGGYTLIFTECGLNRGMGYLLKHFFQRANSLQEIFYWQESPFYLSGKPFLKASTKGFSTNDVKALESLHSCMSLFQVRNANFLKMMVLYII